MQWCKRGVVFTAGAEHPSMVSHAQIPTPDAPERGVTRIYFGSRDADNRTFTAWVEVSADDPLKVLRVADRPVLAPGMLGAFDDCGAMPSCVVTVNDRKFLYYIGWNRGGTVRYHNSIGVAVSEDGGDTFNRMFDGPIMDRTHLEPYFVVTPFVLVEEGLWRMWYCGCTEWLVQDGMTEPRYQIKYAESSDGIHWRRNNTVCIPYESPDEANTRPCVVRDGGRYRMWYCYRSTQGYRTDASRAYRLGYAESADGIRWMRKDAEAGLLRSSAGWDAEMIAYPYITRFGGRWHMLYNGNGFGKTGFGYAVAPDDGVQPTTF